jgi:hypothetical protein
MLLLGGGENLTLMISIRHVQFLCTITVWWCTHETLPHLYVWFLLLLCSSMSIWANHLRWMLLWDNSPLDLTLLSLIYHLISELQE